MKNLCLEFRFIHGRFHGVRRDGKPEWPPSPMRTFCALTNAAASLSGNPGKPVDDKSLKWLEGLPPPSIFAPEATNGSPWASVGQNNDLDIVAIKSMRGKDGFSLSPRENKVLKGRVASIIHPHSATLPDEDTWVVRFVYEAEDIQVDEHFMALRRIARAVTHLGHGIDAVIGEASVVGKDEMAGWADQEWVPSQRGTMTMLVPCPGSLDDLGRRHLELSLRGTTKQGNVIRQPLSIDTEYRLLTDHEPPPYVAFDIISPLDARPVAFPHDNPRQAVGMIRHLADTLVGCEMDDFINGTLLGHPAEGKPNDHILFIPLPSIIPRERGLVVGMSRRMLLCSNGNVSRQDVEKAGRVLSRKAMVRHRDGQAAVLSPARNGDWVIGQYVGLSHRWDSVTPVILPRHWKASRKFGKRGLSPQEHALEASKRSSECDELFREAMLQAGYPAEMVENARLEFRSVGAVRGSGHAMDVLVPDHLEGRPRLHASIEWFNKNGNPLDVYGPVCIGAGRHYGLGLFVKS